MENLLFDIFLDKLIIFNLLELIILVIHKKKQKR